MGLWSRLFGKKEEKIFVFSSANDVTSIPNKEKNVPRYKVPENADMDFFLAINPIDFKKLFEGIERVDLKIKILDKDGKTSYSGFNILFDDAIMTSETSNNNPLNVESFSLVDKVKHWIILSQKLNSGELKTVFLKTFAKKKNAEYRENPGDVLFEDEILEALKDNFDKSFAFNKQKDEDRFILLDSKNMQKHILSDLFGRMSRCISISTRKFFEKDFADLYKSIKSDQDHPIKNIFFRIIFDLSLYFTVNFLKRTDDVFSELYEKSFKDFVSYLDDIRVNCFQELGVDDFEHYVKNLLEFKELKPTKRYVVRYNGGFDSPGSGRKSFSSNSNSSSLSSIPGQIQQVHQIIVENLDLLRDDQGKEEVEKDENQNINTASNENMPPNTLNRLTFDSLDPLWQSGETHLNFQTQ